MGMLSRIVRRMWEKWKMKTEEFNFLEELKRRKKKMDEGEYLTEEEVFSHQNLERKPKLVNDRTLSDDVQPEQNMRCKNCGHYHNAIYNNKKKCLDFTECSFCNCKEFIPQDNHELLGDNDGS